MAFLFFFLKIGSTLELKYITPYIEVQNQVKYGGHLDFFSSRCFRTLLNTQAPVAQGSLSKKLTFPHRCGDEHISECVVMTTCVWSGPHVCGDHNTHVVMTTHMPDGTYVDITPPVWTSTNIILP